MTINGLVIPKVSWFWYVKSHSPEKSSNSHLQFRLHLLYFKAQQKRPQEPKDDFPHFSSRNLWQQLYKQETTEIHRDPTSLDLQFCCLWKHHRSLEASIKRGENPWTGSWEHRLKSAGMGGDMDSFSAMFLLTLGWGFGQHPTTTKTSPEISTQKKSGHGWINLPPCCLVCFSGRCWPSSCFLPRWWRRHKAWWLTCHPRCRGSVGCATNGEKILEQKHLHGSE